MLEFELIGITASELENRRMTDAVQDNLCRLRFSYMAVSR